MEDSDEDRREFLEFQKFKKLKRDSINSSLALSGSSSSSCSSGSASATSSRSLTTADFLQNREQQQHSTTRTPQQAPARNVRLNKRKNKFSSYQNEEHPGKKPGIDGEKRHQAIGGGRHKMEIAESWTVPIIETHLKRKYPAIVDLEPGRLSFHASPDTSSRGAILCIDNQVVTGKDLLDYGHIFVSVKGTFNGFGVADICDSCGDFFDIAKPDQHCCNCKNFTQQVDQPLAMGQSQNFVAGNESSPSSNVNGPSLCVSQSSWKDDHAEIYRLEGEGLQILRSIKTAVMQHSDEEAWDDLEKSNFIDIDQGNFVDSIIAASMHSDFLNNIGKPLRVAFSNGGTQTRAVDRGGPRDQFFTQVMYLSKELLPVTLTSLKQYEETGVDLEGDLSSKSLKKLLYALGLMCSLAVLQGSFYDKFFFNAVVDLSMSNPFNKAAEKVKLASAIKANRKVMETVFREAEVDFMKFQSILEKNSSLNNDIAVRVMEANTYDHFLDFCREIEAGRVKASKLDANGFPTEDEELATFGHLYLFITGSKNIPPSGMVQRHHRIQLTFSFDKDNIRPFATTCSSSLELPVYATKLELFALLKGCLNYRTLFTNA